MTNRHSSAGLRVEQLEDRLTPAGSYIPAGEFNWTQFSPSGELTQLVWEGQTLVVETTNLTDKFAFQGASENMRLTERFTRVAEDTIRYQFTVDDPSTWTRPWSAEVLWKQTTGPIFEHACHEGNYGLYNTLSGARAEEKRTAEEAAKKGSLK